MKFAKISSMRPLIVLPVLATAIAVAGCGTTSGANSSSHVAQGQTTSSVPATTTSTTTAASVPAATSTATTSPPSSEPPPCVAADLSLTFLGGQGATGHGELGFALRNTSPRTCSTIGYPGVQFLDRAGGALPTIATHTTQDFFGQIPELPLTVASGEVVSFRLGVTHGMTSTVGCTTAYGLQVIPPNDTATLRIAIPNGAYECRTATVSPLAQGTTAYLGA